MFFDHFAVIVFCKKTISQIGFFKVPYVLELLPVCPVGLLFNAWPSGLDSIFWDSAPVLVAPGRFSFDKSKSLTYNILNRTAGR